MHAFQGRTVDNVIAAMEARHPHLTTQKAFYVEISRARDRAELVTDDVKDLRAQLQAVTGERIAALEGIGETAPAARDRAVDALRSDGKSPSSGPESPAAKGIDGQASQEKALEPPTPERSRGSGMDLGL